MACDIEWITYKGTITKTNQDYCGIAIRDDHVLYCVVDGSSRNDQSGSLANEFVKALMDKFVEKAEINSVNSIISLLNELSEKFKTSHPAGRLSFLILFYSGCEEISAIHAGDCRMGKIKSDNLIIWLTRVHTLANALKDIEEAELRKRDDRHVLTRNFRPGRPCDPEVTRVTVVREDTYIMSTDGLWADLNAEQKASFMGEGFYPSNNDRDDASCLILKKISTKDVVAQAYGNGKNIYIVRN